MFVANSWYAGHKLKQSSVTTEDEVGVVLKNIQRDLDTGTLSLSTCGMIIPIEKLCVDILKNGKLYRMVNL